MAEWGRNNPRGGDMEDIDVEMNVIRDFTRRVLLSEETFQGEKDDYRHVAAFYGRACPGIDCNVCTSHVGSLSGSQDPLLSLIHI